MLKPIYSKAVYPGSFDPFTNGHLTIYKKALLIFSEVIILFADNPDKSRYVPYDLMKNMVCKHIRRISIVHNPIVDYTDGFVADYCRKNNISYLIRGLRNTNDYVYEEGIAKINKEIFPELETVYLRADNEIISSSMVKAFIKGKKNISPYIPNPVYIMMRERDYCE